MAAASGVAAALALGGCSAAACLAAQHQPLPLPEPEPEPEPATPAPAPETQPAQQPAPAPEPEQPAAAPPLYCTLPPALRVERRRSYDATAYPFRELLSRVIVPEGDVDGAARPLEQIHRSDEVLAWLTGVRRNGSRAYAVRRNCVDKRFKGGSGAAHRPFSPETPLGQCYLKFLREVVLPAVQAGLGGEDGAGPGCGGGILYQREPNFRCHIPDTGLLLVHKHCDADYHHQQNEINFWVPITSCFGNNTVWCESEPGKQDFRPFDIGFGELVQFWGNQCVHYVSTTRLRS